MMTATAVIVAVAAVIQLRAQIAPAIQAGFIWPVKAHDETGENL